MILLEFNKFKEMINSLDTIEEQNSKLIERYPFLLPRNRFSGEVSKNYDFSYTELTMGMPTGWIIAFSLDMCEEIKNELVKIGSLDEYRISQIKEKYGHLRWYSFGTTSDIEAIISKYSKMSEITCEYCGEKSEYITHGWISTACEKHARAFLSNIKATRLSDHEVILIPSIDDDEKEQIEKELNELRSKNKPFRFK